MVCRWARIPLEDVEGEAIQEHFQAAVDFVQDAQFSGGPALSSGCPCCMVCHKSLDCSVRAGGRAFRWKMWRVKPSRSTSRRPSTSCRTHRLAAVQPWCTAMRGRSRSVTLVLSYLLLTQVTFSFCPTCCWLGGNGKKPHAGVLSPLMERWCTAMSSRSVTLVL